jgi:hypothetical protein
MYRVSYQRSSACNEANVCGSTQVSVRGRPLGRDHVLPSYPLHRQGTGRKAPEARHHKPSDRLQMY